MAVQDETIDQSRAERSIQGLNGLGGIAVHDSGRHHPLEELPRLIFVELIVMDQRVIRFSHNQVRHHDRIAFCMRLFESLPSDQCQISRLADQQAQHHRRIEPQIHVRS